jgi:hypothetical protein
MWTSICPGRSHHAAKAASISGMQEADFIPFKVFGEKIGQRRPMALPSILPHGMQPGLRPAINPSELVANQPVLRFPKATCNNYGEISFGSIVESEPLPQEFFLRELPQLSDDVPSIMQLVREVGLPRLPDRLLPKPDPVTGELDLDLELAWALCHGEGIHYLNAKWGLRALRAASITYRQFAADTDGSLLESWVENLFELPEEAGTNPESFALYWMATIVDAGLEPFQPRIGFDVWQLDDPVLHEHGLVGIDYTVDLYQAVCAQVASFIAVGGSPKQCTNENCAKWFCRRLEKTDAGQRRTTGVKYCSDLCARAQGERDRRQKAKQETLEQAEGSEDE